MYSWLYFIRSNEEYHKLMDYLLENEEFSGIGYLIYSEDLKCEDGRIFLRINRFLIAVNFFTNIANFRDNMAKSGLNLDSLVDLYEIECEDKDPRTRGITITGKAEYIVFDKNFMSFIRRNHFKFKDGSTLTIPKVCSNRRL